MPDPVAVKEVVKEITSPISYDLLFGVIGSLVSFIIVILSAFFTWQVKAIWKRINKHESEIEENQKAIQSFKIGELSLKIEQVEKSTNEIKDELKEVEEKRALREKESEEKRALRDKDIFEKIDEIKDLFYNIK